MKCFFIFFFFSSRRRHTRFKCDWSSDVCSSDLNGQGITPMNTGLVVLPQAAAMAVMMPFAGRIYDRIGARWPAMIGVLISLVGSYMMVGISADTTRPEMVLWTVIRAAGISMAFMPIMTVGLAALPPSIINSGSAISQIAQRVSNALGVAALGALSTVQ